MKNLWTYQITKMDDANKAILIFCYLGNGKLYIVEGIKIKRKINGNKKDYTKQIK